MSSTSTQAQARWPRGAVAGGRNRRLHRDGSRGVRTIEGNLDRLRLSGATILRRDAVTGLAQEVTAGRKYDLVLADSALLDDELRPACPLLPGVLSTDGLLVLESDARTEPELTGLTVRTSRRYGSTRVTVFEHLSMRSRE